MSEGPQILPSSLKSTTSQEIEPPEVLFQGTSHSLFACPGCLWPLWHHCPPSPPPSFLSPASFCNSRGHSFGAHPSWARWPHTFWGGSCLLRAAREEDVLGRTVLSQRGHAGRATECPAHGQRVGEIQEKQLMFDLRLTGESGGSCFMPPTWIRALHCAAINA